MKPNLTLTHSILTFLFIANFCCAQTQKIDSLQNLLKTANDTTKVQVLRSLGIQLRRHNKEEALDYAQQSLELSQEIGYVQGEIKALYSMGLTHGMTESYAESLEYLKRCLNLAAKNEDFISVDNVYNALGIVYKRIGDYPTSQSYYLKSLELVDSLKLEQDVSSIYTNLGVLHDLMGDQAKAVESYETALEVYSGEDRRPLEQLVLGNLAVMDLQNDNYEEALDKFLRRQAFAEEEDDNIDLCWAYSNIGKCYLNLGQWELAQNYLQRSLELAEQLSLKQWIATNYHSLAELMLRQKKYNQAIFYLNKNLDALNLMGQYEHKKHAHELAYKIYEADGQLPKAIDHLNQTMAYKDSLLNETKVREIQNLQIKHDVYIKDRELKENELELELLNTQVASKNKRIIYLAIIIALLALMAGLLYLGYQNKKKSNIIFREKNELISAQNIEIEKMNAELEKRMLRAQMNPHFIFNSLNSIQHLIRSGDKTSALTYLTKFSKLLRQVLESSINVHLVLHDEIELLKIYLELEALRFDDSFSYTFQVDENLDVYQYEVPLLLVQPYIENAILHGLMPKDGEKKLSVSFLDQKDYIECVIEDNGVGYKPRNHFEDSKEIVSRGMSITRQRIDALKKFASQELVKVENLDNGSITGTRVTILIPKD